MGGHNHDDHKFEKIPDWRIYKVEDAPQLVNVRKALAARGLKDPWLRNHVWWFQEVVNHPTRKHPILYILSFGFKYGLIAGIISAAAEKTYFALTAKGHDHDEAHH